MLTNQYAKDPTSGPPKGRIWKIISLAQLSLGAAIIASSATSLATYFSKINSSEIFEIVAAGISAVVMFAFLSTKFKIFD